MYESQKSSKNTSRLRKDNSARIKFLNETRVHELELKLVA